MHVHRVLQASTRLALERDLQAVAWIVDQGGTIQGQA
jgi:hypothetical protein